MQLTLLEMVQAVLADLDSDTVNELGETIEAVQVAQIIRDAYFELISLRDWPFLNGLTSFDSAASGTETQMPIPDEINKVFWVRYNRQAVGYLSPEDFKAMIDRRTWGENGVDAAGYITDRDPLYWTTYDDATAVFDAYDSGEDAFLQQSKITVHANITPTWSESASFVPTLPTKMFPTLLAEAKAAAFVTLKQVPNPREEARARKGRIRFQNNATVAKVAEPITNSSINYGRK